MVEAAYTEMNDKLVKAYGKWLSEIREKAPYFLDNAGIYSNPYYTCVPKGWIGSPVRILIVGEEGFGYNGRDKGTVAYDDIKTGQALCWSTLVPNLNYDMEYDLYPKTRTIERINSPFWRRARKLQDYGICAWTNMDLIHIRSDKYCRLRSSKRTDLHSVDTKILSVQIDILKPTHVVYAGWHDVSLRHELPDLFAKIYQKDKDDPYKWKTGAMTLERDGVYHIIAYHPNYSRRIKGYEESVINELRRTVTDGQARE